VNRPRDIGTKAESAVVRAAQTRGFPWADRKALHGRNDSADVALCPGVVIEVKGGDAARHASDLDIERWLVETALERQNANAAVGFLVVQRSAVGYLNAHRWHSYWRLGWIGDLGPHVPLYAETNALPIRCSLADSFLMLRAAGYGTPLD